MASGNWFQHALRRTQWQPHRQAIALATLGLFVLIIIGALYLSQSASTSTLGRQLEVLIDERNRLEQANEQLRAEIASLQTVARLQGRAQELGFVPAGRSDIEYLVIDGYNHRRGETVAPLQASAAVVPDYEESFVGWVQQQWDAFSRQLESFTQQQAALGAE